MTNEDFVKLALQKADYSEEEINQVLSMKKAPAEEPAETQEKDPAQPEQEKEKEPEASKDISGELEKLRKELEETKKQLKTAQYENTRKSDGTQKPDEKKQIEDIIRSFM